MNKFIRLLVSFILLLTILGCIAKPLTDRQATNRVFTISGDVMTDGVLSYRHLPEKWIYRGDYPYRIGRVQDGNKLYASDKNGFFVQEAKKWYADMAYRPWVLSTVELPEVPTDNVDVYVAVQQQGEFVLSEQGHNAFMAWYLENLPGEAEGLQYLYTQPFAGIYFEMSSVPELQYDLDYRIVRGDGVLYVTNSDCLVIGTFGPETLLYQEIEAFIASNVQTAP